jgi:hypothetical protein
MAQVDHDLTIVNHVDQQLRLIKNLGRHNNASRKVDIIFIATDPLASQSFRHKSCMTKSSS